MPESKTLDEAEVLQGALDEAIETIQDNDSVDGKDKKPEKNSKKNVSHSLADLTFVRLIDPIHIPSYLVEQIKDRSYPVENFYDYQKICCLTQTDKGPILNPSNLLYAVVHEKLRQVKGFAWLAIDFLNNALLINAFQMDKEYWNKGDAVTLLDEKAKKIIKDLSLDRIVWITKTPKFCEIKGFKKSKDTVMIYETNEE